MRRTVLLTLAAALVLASAASAALQPVRRTLGERTVPLVRPGVVHIPAGHARGRVTVLVDLGLPPLAARGGSLFAYRSNLNVGSASSRAYLARLARVQRRAAAGLKRAIPSAQIRHRYRVILDGFAVELPVTKLPTLARLSFVTKIYPSLRYREKLNRSPALIHADAFWSATGNRGEGVKIGVVDDGVDPTNPFFDPGGYSYPAGFPRGGRAWTTPKVIVARAFPGPGSGRQGRLALDRRTSFHGTHVAGIAAGNAGTAAGAGLDHPFIPGLSGIAPGAWIGNYRVFNAPTPTGGYDAFTPEIVAAFEAAVRDGMDVINFSGGGPQADPEQDALVEAVRNVANAGVVPVFAGGNDRDDFGLGSVGSPGTAPDAISVAAVSNTHVFAPALTLRAAGAPASLTQVPVQTVVELPQTWSSADVMLADVGPIVGTEGTPVDRRLCGPVNDPNGPRGNVPPPHTMDGAIALVFRGGCTFFSKAVRAHDAGAVGMLVVDNRFGEANPIPLRIIDFPMCMVSDLDGAGLRDYLASHGGRSPIRISSATQEIVTGRSGIVTSFSSAGPTSFGHRLKPDLAAPGGQILSSTLPEFAGGPFAVFDGTSMATPHVTGAAALLVQHHPNWSPAEVKSALMSTAGAAWGNTARTVEAPVTLEGGGLINVSTADTPRVFTDPQSLSFGDLDANTKAPRRTLGITVSDAGGGAGMWTVELHPQSASVGAALDLPASITVPPGGSASFGASAHANAGAAAGDNYGLIVLRRGIDTRRIPYLFLVTRPALESAVARPLRRLQQGTTGGTSRVSAYRFPSAPFGPATDYYGPPMNQAGSEDLYVTHLANPAANLGVAVVGQSRGSLIDPWFLGSPDENDVQGYSGTPVNVNVLTFGFRIDVGAAGSVFPRPGRYFVSVDSGSDPFTGQSFAGRYLLRSWVNDVRPPKFKLLTTRVTAGRPLIAARVTDRGAGVDPISLVINYRRVLLGAALYDSASGLAIWAIPGDAPAIPRGRLRATTIASDYQESKNIDQAGGNILPNTIFRRITIRGVRAATVTWLLPQRNACAARAEPLVVSAGATRRILAVRFFAGSRRIATVRRGASGLYIATWRTARAARGKHLLRAVVSVRGGGDVAARRSVRVCRRR